VEEVALRAASNKKQRREIRSLQAGQGRAVRSGAHAWLAACLLTWRRSSRTNQTKPLNLGVCRQWPWETEISNLEPQEKLDTSEMNWWLPCFNPCLHIYTNYICISTTHVTHCSNCCSSCSPFRHKKLSSHPTLDSCSPSVWVSSPRRDQVAGLLRQFEPGSDNETRPICG